ncbi:hypothetical protein HORIV_36760 [Vreelandella olivaria]|uniref:Uncharacterized protein n=1 Tax=Vreelandella olivaria TaxID=390919 RepID=A0ABN5WXX7_9GAMM|nr:hypothetical protein HORIV_36760 [Halomonas olivaria]
MALCLFHFTLALSGSFRFGFTFSRFCRLLLSLSCRLFSAALGLGLRGRTCFF